jgi:hypothetical protein
MSALVPLTITHSGGSRVLPLYTTASRTRSFAVSFETVKSTPRRTRVIGDLLENPSELVFSVYLQEVNQSVSYALAFTIISEAETATTVTYHEGVQFVNGIMGSSVAPDGLGVRLTLRFAPTSSVITAGTVGGITGAGIAATGGTESTITVSGESYRLHVFNSSSTLTLNSGFAGIVNVEYLVIAGGGGGAGGVLAGISRGGGGGAGGYRSSVIGQSSGGGASAEPRVAVIGNVPVTVGDPGVGGLSGTNGTSGLDSEFDLGTFAVKARGGGAGSTVSDGFSGGSGGGAGGTSNPQIGGAGLNGQGFSGGAGGTFIPGGGGGAGGAAVGVTAGAGLASNITGSSVTRAAGGTNLNVGAGSSAAANSGSGGDGGASNFAGGSGGSGVVIFRYKI